MKIKKASEILIRNWPAKIMSIALAVLLSYFYKINTTEIRYMNIPLDVVINSAFIAAELHPTEVRVSLRGSENSISLISEKDISAEADFSSWKKSGVYREPVRIKKSGNALYADPLEIRVEPGEIYLKIEEKIVKNLDVIPVINGFPAENHELVSYTVTPDNISAEGPASLMEKLTVLKTESINLDGRKESFTLPVMIDL
ncbi:MAG: CdaR family protein, partial [Spirochaetia bacterium]|nr:CdaR family protein [Spirochaetia bacterium]